MNTEQAKTLRRGQLLRATTSLGCGIEPGAVVIAHGPTDDPYIAFNWGGGFSRECTGGNRYNVQNFELWIPDLSIAVMNLNSTSNAQLQVASFANGYRWTTYGPAIMHSSYDSLLFCYDKTLRYNVSHGNPAYFYLNAADSLQWAAALLLLGGLGPRSIESILQPDLLALVRNNSTNELLRGLIRAATGKAVPKETIQAGGNAIIEWLLEAFNPKPVQQPIPVAPSSAVDAIADALDQATPAAAPPPTLPPTLPPNVTFEEAAPPERTFQVRYRFVDTETGTVNVSMTRTYAGVMEVPESVVSDGHDAIEEHIRAYCDCSVDGTPVMDPDDIEWDGYENGDIESNASQVIQQLSIDRQLRNPPTLAILPSQPTNDGGATPQ